MRYTQVQNRETERISVSIKNANASLAILDGMPVFMNTYNQVQTDVTAGTSLDENLGVDVRTYSTATGSSIGGLFLGIAKVNNLRTPQSTGCIVGDIAEAICYGFTDAIVVRRTRATSTDTWATIASIGAGDQLVPETGNNYLTWSATFAIGAAAPPIVAGQSVASLATFGSSANTNAVAATAETVRMKVFICRM